MRVSQYERVNMSGSPECVVVPQWEYVNRSVSPECVSGSV